MKHLRPPLLILSLITLWQLVVLGTGVPPYILPGPLPVARALVAHLPMLAPHLATTVIEILLGLVLGTLLGSVAALSLIAAATGFDERGQMMGIAMSTVTLGVLVAPMASMALRAVLI